MDMAPLWRRFYSHLIMPLANYRDKVAPVRWGIRDFESRFGRKPEGMWLAEAASRYGIAASTRSAWRSIPLSWPLASGKSRQKSNCR
jgi:predicted glycosyl hydrolase (DUF1957 family)